VGSLADKSKKINVSLVVGIQAAGAILIAGTIITSTNMGSLFGPFTRGDLIVGALNFMTMFCSNYSLKFVNYPFMVLAKSAKVLPVILTGWMTGVYQVKPAQLFIAIMITLGLVIFNLSKVQGLADESVFGVVLVLVSLLFDGFVGSQQDKNHKTQQRPYAYHTMLYNNCCIFVGNLILYSHAYFLAGDSSIERIWNDASLLRDTCLIALLGAFGQIFIYLTISIFNNYICSIITTSRKCLSVVISNFLFDHRFTPEQWVGASMVMASTCAEVYLGSKKK